jgi:hypothetical protein
MLDLLALPILGASTFVATKIFSIVKPPKALPWIFAGVILAILGWAGFIKPIPFHGPAWRTVFACLGILGGLYFARIIPKRVDTFHAH